jgi:hypothetical protein
MLLRKAVSIMMPIDSTLTLATFDDIYAQL